MAGPAAAPRRRLAHLVRCTAAAAAAGSGASTPAVQDDDGATAATSAEPTAAAAAIRPLTLKQVKQFIRDGFIVLQINDVPEGFHDGVFAKALSMSDDAKHAESGAKVKLGPGGRMLAEGKESDWSTLAEDFETMLDTPTIRGAAATLAGAGCVIPSAGSPSPLTANPFDQQFHKDGTGTVVREHFPRTIGAWYYPHETTVIMGPTAIVPGSHLFGIDRNGFPHSEERIDLRMTPPKSRAEWQEGLLSWNGHALSIFGHLGVDPTTGDLPVPERERRIAEYRELFGDPTFKEHKLTVPAGSIVIKHNDIVHRRCRSGEDGATDDGVEWRPMFGLSWTRTEEPGSGSLILAPDDDDEDEEEGGFSLTAEEAAHPESAAKLAVWESILSWMQGHGPVPPSVLAAGAQLLTIEEVARLGALIETSESETERVGSAYKLGAAIRQPGAVGDGAMDCLLGCMVHGEERVRRAATWGIGLGGDKTVPSLLGLLQENDLDTLLDPIARQAVRTNAGYALRVAAETATPLAVDALEATLSACEEALARRVEDLPAEAREELEASHNRGARGWDGNMYSCVLEMDHEVHELRKTMATATVALGQLGHLAMAERCGGGVPPGETALRILAILQRMHEDYMDPAAIFPTHLSSGLIRAHAERALCAMLSPPVDASSAAARRSMSMDRPRETGGGRGLAALALDRLREAGGATETAKLVLAELE